MKALLVIVALIMSISLLFAYGTDEAIDFVLNTGTIDYYDNQVYFFSDTILSRDLYEQADAMYFIAQSAFVFLLVQQDWVEYTVSKSTSEIKKVRYIACPFAETYQNYIAIIPMSGVRTSLDFSSYAKQGEQESFRQVLDYVKQYAQIRNLDMFIADWK